MTILATNLRNKLEKVVIEAREAAETGAKAALESMAVNHHEPYGHMTPDERKLRNRLRAHGRQLGDHYDSKKGTQTIDHLINECAYEHWHRMLFARFLAENDLLIEPEMGVPISLEECEELAKDQKIDPWVLSSRYAQQMLPQIFRPDDPVLQVTFAREHLLILERLLESLEPEVFTTSDAIGWVYQFWQSKKKDEVNRSGKKIGADELPAVTQLFTEDYMVEFLLHNTLGAWWSGKIGPIKANSEDEARAQVKLSARDGAPEISWTYLRFVQDETTKTWVPAAGTFQGWPKSASLIRLLDPCMGSGHFLVFAIPLLVRVRMNEEKLSLQASVVAVLRDNIYGLELDERCSQIAAFNVALTTWKLAGYQALPCLNLACSGLAPSATEAEWMALAGESDRLKRGMTRLYKLFKDAPLLGSLINPRLQGGDLIEADFHEIAPLLEKALTQETKDVTSHEMAVTAHGLAKAAEILAYQFTLVATNVPYLGRKKHDYILKDYCERIHPDAKADLATCFVERSLTFCAPSGSIALVTPQNWLSLGGYEKLRQCFLRADQWDFAVRLGPKAFQTPMWDFNILLIGITRCIPFASHFFSGFDVSELKTPTEKDSAVRSHNIVRLNQKAQLTNPDARVSVGEQTTGGTPFGDYVECYQGVVTGDLERFRIQFWEVQHHAETWRPFRTSISTMDKYDGLDSALLWEDGKGQLQEYATLTRDQLHDMHESGNRAWAKIGVAINRIAELRSTSYLGEIFDNNVAVAIPKNPSHLSALLAFCSSSEFHDLVRNLDQTLKVTNRTLIKVPFDLAYWQKVAAEKYHNGLPKPHSDNPTQWLFNGHPKGSEQPLHVAVARLLGYHWPRQTGSSFPDCPTLDSDGLESFADEDGIVCIPSIRGEDAAVERLRELLGDAYGNDWSPAKERELVTATQATDLDDWLRNSFFEQHCVLFHHRPFVWHIWDGRKRDGFHALVNYHRLAETGGKGRQLLEKLTYGYLGDWITLQKDGVKQGTGGADDRLATALELEKRLKAILEGEPPFDIFVRWKPIEKQPIGWEPDINDGVRLNIRPFMADDIPGGKRGAGILRWKPNIKWEKDRGKDVASAPWFDLGPQYGGHSGDRINDHHLTCEEKRKVREAMEKTKEKQT